MEHLYLKNFGPIKEMDIDLKPLMVFIGESGSGKSAILKLLSLLRWVHKQNNLRTYFVKSSIAKKKSDYSRLSSEALLKMSGLDELVRKDTIIRFQIGDTLYESKEGKIRTDAKLNGDLTLDKIAFISENRGVLPDIYANKIPRSFKLPYYLEDTYDNFLTAFEQLGKKEFFIESTDLILFQKKGILPKFFIKDKGNTFEMKFENSSSGTKTVLFPEIIVSYLTQKYDFKDVLARGFNDFLMSRIQQMQQLGEMTTNINLAKFSGRNLSIFIEEPELSLFPSAQRRLLNRLVRDCFAENKQENCVTNLAFATHSPYILTSLNNLLLAGETAKLTEKRALVSQVVSEEYWLTAEQVGAYAIENGKVNNIIEGDNLIDGAYLDSISDEISSEFSSILDIEYGNRE
jgi:hypothetical protein